MKTKKVVVLPYNAEWKSNFEAIKAELLIVLDNLPISIEHVGSTSIEGLAAKPIIDIDIVIKDYSVFDYVVKALEQIGYWHRGDLGIKDREAFGYLGKEHLQKHHLYVCPMDSKELKRHITFRDYLREHPEAVEAYGQIKKEGARLYPDNIEEYIEYKSEFIDQIYQKCGLV